MRLKNLVQYLIDQKIINVEQPAGNQNLKIYTNLIPNHNNKGNNNKDKGKGTFKSINHVYDHVITSLDEYFSTITIKGSHVGYGVTPRGGKITIARSS